MGMFTPKGDRLNKKQMVKELEKIGANCKLCSTTPSGMVYDAYKQKVWCPRCGMPPIPAPEFLKKENK